MAHVFVVSYPKCGRTWLRLMLGRALAAHTGHDVDELLDGSDRAPPAGLPRITFTHDGPANLKSADELADDDKSAYAGNPVVLLVRDPADVVVSYFFEYTRRRAVFNPTRFEGFDGDLSAFLRRERGGLDSILAFYDGWARRAHVPSRLLVVRYEDMHDAPARELHRVLAFIGITGVSRDVIDAAVAYGRFDNMRQLEERDALGSERLRPGDPTDPESYKTRRGVVGGYVDYLSAADIDYVTGRRRELPALFAYPS